MNCKFRISGHVAENLTFTFRAGFPNKTGGVTYFGDPIEVPINSGAPISKPEEKKGVPVDASSKITPGGGVGGGVTGSGGASVAAKGISGGNVGGGNPPPVPGSKKILTKEEY